MFFSLPSPPTPGLHILGKVQPALVSCGFCVCTFASALTFVTPRVSTRDAFAATCGRAGQREACPSQLEEGDGRPPAQCKRLWLRDSWPGLGVPAPGTCWCGGLGQVTYHTCASFLRKEKLPGGRCGGDLCEMRVLVHASPGLSGPAFEEGNGPCPSGPAPKCGVWPAKPRSW